jgi:hypothetical protein
MVLTPVFWSDATHAPTLDRAMGLIVIVALVAAMVIQGQRAAERETRYRTDIARLRRIANPDFLQLLDHNPKVIDDIKP